LKVRGLIGPLAGEMLRLKVSIVFDFAGNTVECRRWVRTIFEGAKVGHLLHLIGATDAQSLSNIHRRNKQKPAGLYFGHVADETFRRVTEHFTPQQPEEGFLHRRVRGELTLRAGRLAARAEGRPFGLSGKSGGRTRTRTWDPLIKSQLLYQLSYAPPGPGERRYSKGWGLCRGRRAVATFGPCGAAKGPA
jgi:hypothetical protein